MYEGLSVRLSVRPSIYPSVRPPVRPSVRPSVRRSVGPSVRGPAIFLIAEIDKKQHRIIGKVETLFLDCNRDSIISMPFPLKIRDSKKTRNGPTTDGRTDGRTDPHIEMRGRI